MCFTYKKFTLFPSSFITIHFLYSLSLKFLLIKFPAFQLESLIFLIFSIQFFMTFFFFFLLLLQGNEFCLKTLPVTLKNQNVLLWIASCSFLFLFLFVYQDPISVSRMKYLISILIIKFVLFSVLWIVWFFSSLLCVCVYVWDRGREKKRRKESLFSLHFVIL